jgi:hypothetical protein
MSRGPTGKAVLAKDVSSILPAMSGMSESLSVDGYKSYLNEEVTKELTIVKDKTNLLYSRMFVAEVGLESRFWSANANNNAVHVCFGYLPYIILYINNRTRDCLTCAESVQSQVGTGMPTNSRVEIDADRARCDKSRKKSRRSSRSSRSRRSSL